MHNKRDEESLIDTSIHAIHAMIAFTTVSGIHCKLFVSHAYTTYVIPTVTIVTRNHALHAKAAASTDTVHSNIILNSNLVPNNTVRSAREF